MERRTFLGMIAGGPLTAPLAAEAQPAGKTYRVGFLSPLSSSGAAADEQAFREGLRDLGWVEGKNIRIDYRHAAGRNERLAEHSAEFVRLKVDVIVASIATDALVAKNTTKVIPIVMASAGDPVASGLVESLARPGGNVTGLSSIAPEMAGKRLALLKEMIPTLSRVAVFWNPQGSTSSLGWKELHVPARQLGVQLHSVEVRSSNDLPKAVEDARRAGAGAVAIMPDPLFGGNLDRIADLAIKGRLPAIFHLRQFADAGGLMAYGANRPDMFRRAAAYVDKILNGAKPADLPIALPTKFELVINRKTAKALGLTIPPSLLQRADQVIE